MKLKYLRPYIKEENVVQQDYRYSYGFGLRYNTPVGPIRLDYGILIKRDEFTDNNGRLHISLGQIFYFNERKVQLGDKPPVDEDFSPFLSEFAWHITPRLRTIAGLQWDWERSQVAVGSLGFNYRGKKGERIRFEYRFRRDRVDQFDFRIFWPINEAWRILSRVNYSFDDSDLLEVQGGIEYESCCWAIRTVLRRYLRNRDGDYRDGIFLELNLKGLTSIGNQRSRLFYD